MMFVCGYVEERYERLVRQQRRRYIDKSLPKTEREREKKSASTNRACTVIRKEQEEEKIWREEKDCLVVYLPDLFHLTISLFTYQSKQEIFRPSSLSLLLLSYRKYSQEIQLMLLSTGGR